MKVAGFDQRCSECHALFESTDQPPANLMRHEDIVLEHGLNDRCLNCHSTKDRDKLVLHGEVESRLCDADHLGPDADAPFVERLHGDLVAFAHLSQDVL